VRIVFGCLVHYHVQNFYSVIAMKITKTTIQTLLDTAISLRADDFYEVADVLKHHDDDSIALDSIAFLPVITFCFANNAIALKIRRFLWANPRENLAYGLLSAGNSTVEKVLKILKEHNLLTKKNYKRLVDTQKGQSKLQLLSSLYVQLDNALMASGVLLRGRPLSDFIAQLAIISYKQQSEFLACLVALSKCRGFLKAKEDLNRMGHIDNTLWDAKQFPLAAGDISVLITNYASQEGMAVPLKNCIVNASDLGLHFTSLVQLMDVLLEDGVAAKLSLVNRVVEMFSGDDVSHQLQRDLFKLALGNTQHLDYKVLGQLGEVSPKNPRALEIAKGIIVGSQTYDASIAKLGLFQHGVELSEVLSRRGPPVLE
jgi:hypothetical protein